MKLLNRIVFTLALIIAAALLPGCSDSDDNKPAETAKKPETPGKAGVTMDAATQERLGLKMERPAAAQWQPQLPAVGRVVDPLMFMAAAADYEAARAAAVATGNELTRAQLLASQNNASSRTLETAQAAAVHDSLALKSAQAKFTADWGVRLAAQTNLVAFAENLQTGGKTLIKLALPSGLFPNPLPATAMIYFLSEGQAPVAADLADDLGIDPATQTQTLLFSTDKKLPPGISVTAQLKISGEAVSGVTVPPSAVLRHEGRGWVYVQAEINQFMRREIPLDRLTADGWFVSENLSTTNQIVTRGAQAVLSAELGGGFNTGERD